MDVKGFLDAYNPLALTLTITYCGAYIGHVFLKRSIGDFSRTQELVIHGMARQFDGNPLINAIRYIINENSRILMPPARNWPLYITSFLYLLFAIVTIFYEGFLKYSPRLLILINSKECVENIKNGGNPISCCFYLNFNITYITFFVLLLVGAFLLYLEYRYWVDFKRLKTEYLNNECNVTIRAD